MKFCNSSFCWVKLKDTLMDRTIGQQRISLHKYIETKYDVDTLKKVTAQQSKCQCFFFSSFCWIEDTLMDNVNFVFLSFFFLSHITQKLYGIYDRSAHQTTAPLSEIFLFLQLVRAVCQLRSKSYGSKMCCSLFPMFHFVHTVIHSKQ